MAEQFPLPRSGFKALRLILIGYFHEGGRDRKAVGPADVGRAVGMDKTNVSRNNAFLAAVGLIESEAPGRWRLSEDGAEVAQALEYEASDELRESLGNVLRGNDFIQRVVTFVRSRGGIEDEQLISHIARTAGVPRKPQFLTGARALLDLMVEGGLVDDAGGLIQPKARKDTPSAEPARITPGHRHTLGRTTSEDVWARAVRLTLSLTVSPNDLKSDAAVDAFAARVRRLVDLLGGVSSLDAD